MYVNIWDKKYLCLSGQHVGVPSVILCDIICRDVFAIRCDCVAYVLCVIHSAVHVCIICVYDIWLGCPGLNADTMAIIADIMDIVTFKSIHPLACGI